MAIVFDNDEKGYLAWLAGHPRGFVLTTNKNKSPEYMVLHSAKCYKISNYNKMAQPGGFTERNYIKICSNELEELHLWLSAISGGDGSFSKICSACKPKSTISEEKLNKQYKVLFKAVGSSQHTDGVRINKDFHDIFNPPASKFYVPKGHTRKVKVDFNGKSFKAEYRYEGTKASNADLQRIGFYKDLKDEFKKVFPSATGFFNIRLGMDLNHFIFSCDTQGGGEEYNPVDEEDARERILVSIAMRKGQSKFRQALMEAYSGKCAISECDATEALEAAHITPYMGDQTNNVQNGLLLRADLHTLFDLGLIGISPDYKVILHPCLKDGHYSYLNGKMISVPSNKGSRPSTAALKIHLENSKL